MFTDGEQSRPMQRTKTTAARLSAAVAPYAPHIAGRLHAIVDADEHAERLAHRVLGFVDGFYARSTPTPRQSDAMTSIRRLADELLCQCRERELRALSGAA